MKKVRSGSQPGLTIFIILFIFFLISLGLIYFNNGNMGVLAGGENTGTETLKDDLISYWAFEEDADNTDVFDSHGDNDGTANKNTEDLSTDGKIGNAFEFDGNNDFVVTNDAPGPLNQLTLDDTFSLSLWAYKESDESSSVFSSQDEDHPDAKGIQIGYSSVAGGYMFRLSDGSNRKQVSEDGSSGFNTWHHIIVTYDGSGTQAGMRIYIDGIDVTHAGADEVIAEINNDLNTYIGMRLGEGIGYDGKIDEVAIWSRVLLPEEIDALYNNGSGLAYDFWGTKTSSHSTIDGFGSFFVTGEVEVETTPLIYNARDGSLTVSIRVSMGKAGNYDRNSVAVYEVEDSGLIQLDRISTSQYLADKPHVGGTIDDDFVFILNETETEKTYEAILDNLPEMKISFTLSTYISY